MCPFCLSGGMLLISGVVSVSGVGVWLASLVGDGKKRKMGKTPDVKASGAIKGK